ncbi:head-tail connector protein [Streptomyces flavidovirens]|uniref:head-tail connector protein n=1 Tax=Streptomyces flavidovirens TaxID=67298 RepID=UPI0033B54570
MALLTLAEAKAQLDLDTTTNDVELQAYIDSLTAVIEHHTGPVQTRTVTETIEGRSSVMCLSSIPAVALISVVPTLTDDGPADLATLVLDAPTGIVRRRSGTFAGMMWTVTYTAGRAAVPPTINLAARILLAHLWRTQYGAARGGGGSDDYNVGDPIPGFGYAIPNRVLELLEPYKLPPGVA